jgi:hypothetical protein
MARSKKDTLKCIVMPLTDNARKERFLKINGKVVPFGIPFDLTQDDINAIKRLKEPKRNEQNLSVYDVMDQLKIPQEKANKIMREGGELTKKQNIGFVPKYSIQKA